ncbi:hypothetical protein ACQUQU_13845 [Thalassolituus sp. LLYu03]|uniref:hypothetical protein n=1 Tax=Thalassolituus sp. LLYu03 TaxID=3421656 RepID=UPI003D2D4C54
MMNKSIATLLVAGFMSMGMAQVQAAPEGVQRFAGKQITERAQADKGQQSADRYQHQLTRASVSMHHR